MYSFYNSINIFIFISHYCSFILQLLLNAACGVVTCSFFKIIVFKRREFFYSNLFWTARWTYSVYDCMYCKIAVRGKFLFISLVVFILLISKINFIPLRLFSKRASYTTGSKARKWELADCGLYYNIVLYWNSHLSVHLVTQIHTYSTVSFDNCWYNLATNCSHTVKLYLFQYYVFL